MTLTEQLRSQYAPGVAATVEVPDQTIPQMFEEVARRYPDRVALDFFSRSTTYAQLVQQVRQGAMVLSKAGVSPGDRVGLIMPNCPQHVVAILATMLIGGVVVEHNPLAPAQELEDEFSHHGARVAVAWEKSIEKLSFLRGRALVFSMDLTRALPRTSQFLLRLPVASAKEKREALSARAPAWTKSWDAEAARSPIWRGDCPVAPSTQIGRAHV